ncbi:MAG: hypothetical protein UGF89_06850 [Acutalibacteraceae bacterium]|nr:hypothetical protein [Acutalibacteraceae bacterium]
MNTPEIINEKIIDTYKIWLSEIQSNSPQLLSGEFSNIFCTGINENWFNSDMRILIVGEEATWGSRSKHQYADYYVELKECQKWIIEELNSQLYDNNTKKHPHAFWQRIQDIHRAFPKAQISWTNIDVINTKAGKALKPKDRKVLHSCETRLLHEVIKLTNPTHIIFFGWHNTSLSHEIPELLNIAYPIGIADNSFIKSENFIFKTKLNGISIILSYHPNYVPIRNNKNYINKLIRLIKQEN